MKTKKFCLTEKQMPTQWYNIVADMPNKPLPPLHPATKQPVTKEQMSAIFAEELIDQEMSTERFIDIPEEVQEIYKIWRPSPLVRATGLEKALGTPAKIYFKNESVSPAGSHKPNTAVPQAYYNYKQGIRRLTTETGAGQWGAAIAFAAKHFGIDLQVYMVKVSYEQKPYRRLMMNTWGAECIASPSTITASGRAALERDPNCSGSLGLAISEAIEVALQHPEDTRYCLGSVLNHVILHQTVIGQEAVAQMEMADAEPDVVIGCFGGGSNFAGLGFPFLRKNLTEGKKIRIRGGNHCQILTGKQKGAEIEKHVQTQSGHDHGAGYYDSGRRVSEFCRDTDRGRGACKRWGRKYRRGYGGAFGAVGRGSGGGHPEP